LVNSDLEFPLNFQILDAQGKPVRQKVNLLEKTQQFNFELTKEPSGIYFLKVQDRFGKIIGSVRVFKN